MMVDTTATPLVVDDRQLLDARPLPEVTAALWEADSGLGKAVAAVMAGYADRPALAERVTEAVTDPESGRTTLRSLPRFETLSYRRLSLQVTAIAAEWRHHATRPLAPGELVGIYGFNSVDYAKVDLACVHAGAVTVPLQPGASLAQLVSILTETTPTVLAVGVAYLETAAEALLRSKIRARVIVFDHHPDIDEERETVAAATERLSGLTTVDALTDVIAWGKELPSEPPFTPDPGEDPLRLLIYTSGSTGSPKGAMYTERMTLGLWRPSIPGNPTDPIININYMPMSHIAGRLTLLEALSTGGTACFTARSDLSTLFEDIALVRPTKLLVVPRVVDSLFQIYQSEIERQRSEFDDTDRLETAVKTELRERQLGGRLRHVAVGSAPLAAPMRTFMESCLRQPLHDGYGCTEAGPTLVDNKVQRPAVIDYKLIDVPELGYYSTDKPHPRGELLLKTQRLTPGYYKQPEATAAAFDADGFYRTGDIMALTGPDEMAYLDRRNNVLKLSQGEFVSISILENTLAGSPLIRQIYVYGNSERSYLLAVIVPTEEALAEAGSTEALKPRLLETMRQTARDHELQPYEIPRDVLVETEPFTASNGLLADVGKPLRPRLRDRYGERLERIYTELENQQTGQLAELRRFGSQRPVLETVIGAARSVLGSADPALSPDAHFVDLGGDSLTALSFSALLQEIFGIDVSVGVVISSTNDLQAIADYITERRDAESRPTFASVHGPGSGEVHATDLTLDNFIDAATLDAARRLPRTQPTRPRTVLLTGATGYLGRFLCLDWLERMASNGGTLICLVRGADAAKAKLRLDNAFDTGDAELLTRYHTLAASHLEVIAGDIGTEHLGLDHDTWQRLTNDVDLIVHPAALVNHLLPYRQLFEPNVLGTAELIRLAITSKLKPFTYLSTLAVANGLDPADLDETSDIRNLSPVRKLDDSYASGYGTSKWGGEVLLREAYEVCGLPVSTFRSDMILAHSRYTGQLNVPDRFTRLMLSILATGIAPGSFYRSISAPDRPRPHYDGLPVDFTADIINTLAARNTKDYRTYNVINPHDDGVSLDQFVDWLTDAGHPITLVCDYDDWFERFHAALRRLPERQQRHSVLMLLDSLRIPEEPVTGADVPATEFRSAVRAARVGDGAGIPHLTRALIVKYATDLTQLGLLDAH